MRIQANAKLNLFLNIVGKDDNRYHLLEMITVPLTLFDTIHIEDADVDSVEYDKEIQNDVLYKTIQRIKSEFKIKKSVKLRVSKQIPISGGLGGESADIASTIRGLIAYWNINTSEETIMKIGAELGSDVPVCLFNKPAKVYGVGQSIIPLPSIDAHVLLLYPEKGIQTKDAFKLVDENELKRIDSTRLLIGYMKKDIEAINQHLHNDFIPIALTMDSSTRQALRAFRNINSYASMSGSGSTLFALYSDQNELRHHQEQLHNLGYHTQYCKIL
jgi:4-diphosphocytidyl-2-C-methyl-D-erythritol kinase